MGRTLTDEDIDAVVRHLMQALGARLSTEERPRETPFIPPVPPPPTASQLDALKPKLAYTLKELSEELGVSPATVYRLVYRGLLKPLPYLRTKHFSRAEVERFLSGDATPEIRRPRGRQQ